MKLQDGWYAVQDNIEKRCSVRSYTDELVDEKTLSHLLHLAVRAPCALHDEAWAFCIVQDKALLKRISDLVKPTFYIEAHRLHLDRDSHSLDIFTNPNFNVFYNAGTLVLICATSERPLVAADCWLAAENFMLAAHAAGLGSCVIGSSLSTLNTEEIKRELGIPPSATVVVPVIVGVPADHPEPTVRREPQILSWLR